MIVDVIVDVDVVNQQPKQLNTQTTKQLNNKTTKQQKKQ